MDRGYVEYRKLENFISLTSQDGNQWAKRGVANITMHSWGTKIMSCTDSFDKLAIATETGTALRFRRHFALHRMR